MNDSLFVEETWHDEEGECFRRIRKTGIDGEGEKVRSSFEGGDVVSGMLN